MSTIVAPVEGTVVAGTCWNGDGSVTFDVAGVGPAEITHANLWTVPPSRLVTLLADGRTNTTIVGVRMCEVRRVFCWGIRHGAFRKRLRESTLADLVCVYEVFNAHMLDVHERELRAKGLYVTYRNVHEDHFGVLYTLVGKGARDT
jgi:hypothetical protein